MHRYSLTLALIASLLAATISWADEAADKQAKYRRLEETLSGAKMTGNFTTTGKDLSKLTKEEYIILSAKKVEEGELWLLKVRIKYGDKDTVVPIPLEILWAGDTPVITLTNLTIPGMGTFSSRVVIHEDKYAGTWQHDKVGGHLFGTISKATEEEKNAPPKADAKSYQQ